MASTYVLIERLNPSETFLLRDVEAGSLGPCPTIVELGRYAAACPAALRALRTTRLSWLAKKVCGHHSIEHGDRVVAYWANYVLEVAARIAAMSGATVEVCCHANDVFVRSALGRVDKRLVSAYYFCCLRTLSWARSAYALPAEHVHHRPHPVPDMPVWRQPAVPTLRILNVARDVPKKNLAGVYQAASGLSRIYRDVEFWQAGAENGSAMELSPLRTHFLGSVPFAVVRNLMARSHVLMYGSLVEENGDRDGVPNVLREAGAMGLPIVAEDGWANREAVSRGPALFVDSLVGGTQKISLWLRALYPGIPLAEEDR